MAVLNKEADRNVSVSFNTQDGTAEGKTAYLTAIYPITCFGLVNNRYSIVYAAPGDYSSISRRILEFPAGVKSVMIPVDTAQDVIAEGDEGFEAILSNPTNGLELGSQDRAGITIRDDDGMNKHLSYSRVILFLDLHIVNSIVSS